MYIYVYTYIFFPMQKFSDECKNENHTTASLENYSIPQCLRFSRWSQNQLEPVLNTQAEQKTLKTDPKPAGRERHARIAQARTNETMENARGTSANSHTLHIVDPSNDPLRKEIVDRENCIDPFRCHLRVVAGSLAFSHSKDLTPATSCYRFSRGKTPLFSW